MKTSTLLSNVFRKSPAKGRRRRQPHDRMAALERLEARQLLTATMAWDGDVLEISGSEENDFIAVQQDDLGLKVFTEDTILTEYEGKSFDTATAINVSGLGGNDILFSHQTDIPVRLNGDAGNDFLYSDTASDVLDGGDGWNWIQTSDSQGIGDDAFGVPGLDLIPSNVSVTPEFDEVGRIGLQVDVVGDVNVAGQSIEVTGGATVSTDGVDVVVTGGVSNWNDAFGIDGLDMTSSSLTVRAGTEVHDGDGYRVELSSTLQVSDTQIGVDGTVDISDATTTATFTGTVANWDDAFGIAGLDLTDCVLTASGHVDADDNQEFGFAVSADMIVEDTAIKVSGSVDITPDQIDAVFNGSVDNWDDAFGIDGLNLTNSEVNIAAYSDREDQHSLYVDLVAAMEVDDIEIDVTGSVDITPDQIDAVFNGSVDFWDDAFGIDGLDLSDTELDIVAFSNRQDDHDLRFDLLADMDLNGTNAKVSGSIAVDPDRIDGTLTGSVAAEWVNAFGIAGLSLRDTRMTINAVRDRNANSTLGMSLDADMDLFGQGIAVTGDVDIDETGVSGSFTGVVAGSWTSAFGIPGLNLRDTALTIGAGAGVTGLEIDLDTDLQLFGSYIDMIGDLDISPSGIDFTFSPPASIGFTDLLGIPGFTLNDADLTVTSGANGIEVAVDSTMDLGNIDVDLEGAFSVSRNETQASFTGRVAEWDNAFDVPGLNLNDIVLTLGAESGDGGASMFIGLGAEMEIGSSNLAVAGLLGFGATGWEVAFRGAIDSLESDDLIDFANTINGASDPTAAEIPDGALGDLELRTAYVNFAPNGGNEALGITDGFGIGGAFYNDGKLLGSGEFIVDLASGVFEVGLDIPELNLGPVELNDVLVDIRIATTDSHFHVAGTANLLGAEVSLAGKISSNSFSLQGEAAVDMHGLSASVQFIVDQSGIRFVATSGGGAINAVKDNLTKNLRAVADAAQTAIDHAQSGVDFARRGVQSLEADLAEARAEAQEDVDKVKSNIDKAKVVVDRAQSGKTYWYNQRQAAHKRWRSAVAATKNAKWYNKPHHKAIEASRYASYAYRAGRYAAQVVAHNAANVAYKAVRSSAGWVLDNAGVEANPEVLRLKAMLAVADLGLDAAELILDGVEHANAGVFEALNAVDSIRVNRITIEGNVANFASAGVRVTLDVNVGGRNQLITLNASTEDLVQQLGRQLLSAVL